MSGDPVGFDFYGSLQLARQLWNLADAIDTRDATRSTDAETASAKFEGPHADSFTGRRDQEELDRATVVAALREDAGNWAQAWADATFQQRKNDRAAEVEEIRNNRGLGERFVDVFTGDDSDDQVPMPDPPAVPQPPSFIPT